MSGIEKIKADLHAYLYSKDTDYSDALEGYLTAEGQPDKVKVLRALKLLSYARAEFKKRPDKSQPNLPRINRKNLMEFAIDMQVLNPQSPQVEKKTIELLQTVSRVSQNDYVKRLTQKGRSRRINDVFLNNMIALRHNSDADFMADIVVAHINGMFEKLADNQDKLKYARLLHRIQLGHFVPKEIEEALSKGSKRNSEEQEENEPSTHNKGDKPMADDVKDTEEPAGNTSSDEKKNKFEPSEIEKKACSYAGLSTEQYENSDQLHAALESSGILIKGEKILIKDGTDAAKNVAEAQNNDPDNNKDIEILKPDEFDKLKDEENKKNPLEIDGPSSHESDSTDERNKSHDWVQQKVADYQEMEAQNKIGKINITKGLNPDDTEFEVEVGGGTIHYSSPDRVTVSDTATVETFEAILKEKANTGRPINIGTNMSHESAVLLAAACVLHGNEIQGNVPELTAADKQMLQAKLGERYGEFEQKLDERIKPAEERTGEDKTGEKEPLSESAKKLQEICQEFEQDKAAGLIKVVYNERTNKHDVLVGDGEHTSEEKLAAVLKTQKNLEEAAALVLVSKTKENIPEGQKLAAEQTEIRDDLNHQKIMFLRARMDQNKLAEHDALSPEARAARLEQRRQDMSVKLGITTDPKGENKALQGQELSDYINQNKILDYTYKELWKKANSAKEFDETKLTPEQKAVFAQIPKVPQMSRDNSNNR